MKLLIALLLAATADAACQIKKLTRTWDAPLDEDEWTIVVHSNFEVRHKISPAVVANTAD